MSNKPIETPLPAHLISLEASKTWKNGTVFPAASRAAATYNSDPFQCPQATGIRLYINITNRGAAGTLTVKVQGQDPATQEWTDLPEAVTTALAAVAMTTLTLYPGAEEDANVVTANPIAAKMRVVATVAAEAVTFSI